MVYSVLHWVGPALFCTVATSKFELVKKILNQNVLSCCLLANIPYAPSFVTCFLSSVGDGSKFATRIIPMQDDSSRMTMQSYQSMAPVTPELVQPSQSRLNEFHECINYNKMKLLVCCCVIV